MTPDDAQRQLAAMPAAVEAAIAAALDRVAETAAAAARRPLASVGAGPGAPPADPHGTLANSIVTGRSREGATVSCTAPYAADLEYGTARMPARPFLRPAIAMTADEARQIVLAALQTAMTRTRP